MLHGLTNSNNSIYFVQVSFSSLISFESHSFATMSHDLRWDHLDFFFSIAAKTLSSFFWYSFLI